MTTVYDSEFHVFVSMQSNDLSQTTTTYPPADVVQRQGEQELDGNKSILVSRSYDGQGRLERTSVGYEYGGAPGTYRAVTNWNGVAATLAARTGTRYFLQAPNMH